MNDFNQKAINDAYKNAHIALQSIADLLPSVEHHALKTELKSQYEGYDNVIREMSNFMLSKNITPKDVNFFKKAMLWGSIKMKVAMNNSKNQIAEMMINGSVMGINELTAMMNESENLLPEVKELIEKLLRLEEDYVDRLKQYL